MVITYTNIYHSKALQNLPKFGILGLKTNHLATLFQNRLNDPEFARRCSFKVWSNRFFDGYVSFEASDKSDQGPIL
jgi:hypothetical protein